MFCLEPGGSEGALKARGVTRSAGHVPNLLTVVTLWQGWEAAASFVCDKRSLMSEACITR